MRNYLDSCSRALVKTFILLLLTVVEFEEGPLTLIDHGARGIVLTLMSAHLLYALADNVPEKNSTLPPFDAALLPPLSFLTAGMRPWN